MDKRAQQNHRDRCFRLFRKPTCSSELALDLSTILTPTAARAKIKRAANSHKAPKAVAVCLWAFVKPP